MQKFRQRLDVKCKCVCLRVGACVRRAKNEQDLYSTSPRAKYKQLTQASFNLIDNVLKNNTTYFGCSASTLMTAMFPRLTLCWGGLRLWRGAWWKGMKWGEMEETALTCWNETGGLTNLALNICFSYYGLAKLNKERHDLKRSCMKCDWQVFSLSEPSTWTVCKL